MSSCIIGILLELTTSVPKDPKIVIDILLIEIEEMKSPLPVFLSCDLNKNQATIKVRKSKIIK